ncbi:hypothetical protein HOY80DRAFT_1034444 [Tuber brumale]|nr:hypothetical protein HOY80DRAFT_1034444 [Tuber brumale]
MDLTFEILSAADTCLRIGQNLFERYQETRGVNRHLDSLGLRVENVWTDIASRLETILSSPDAVPGNLRLRMDDLLHRLLYLLHASYRHHEKTTGGGGWTMMKSIKFALFRRRLLEGDVSALQKWRDKFDSTLPPRN